MAEGKNEESRPGANGSAFEDGNAREASTVPEYTFDLGEFGPVADAGFWIVRLGRWDGDRSKFPDRPWGKSRGISYAHAERLAHAGHNLGVKVKLRETLPDGSRVFELIVDVDDRNYALADPNDPLSDRVDTLATIKNATGVDLIAEARAKVRTGSGGLHLYFLLRVPAGMYAPLTVDGLAGIDWVSAANASGDRPSQAVAPGSVHKKSALAGKADPFYRVVPGSDFLNLSYLPESVAALILQPIPASDPLAAGGGQWTAGQLAMALAPINPEVFAHGARVAGVDFIEFFMGCHHATGGCAIAREEALDWAGGDPFYADARWSVGRRWDSFDAAHVGGFTAGTVGLVLKAVMGEKAGALHLARVGKGDPDEDFADDPSADLAALRATSATESGAEPWDWAESLRGYVADIELPDRLKPKKPKEPPITDDEAEYDEHGNLLGFGPFRTMLGMMHQPKGEFLVEGLIRKRGVNTIIGPSASFKTYLALTLAMFASNNRPIPVWNRATMECFVVYVTPETPEDFPGKIAALTDAHPELTTDNFVMLPGALPIGSTPDTERVAELLAMVRRFMKTERHILLIIDTFHANKAEGANSDKGDDVSDYATRLKAINVAADATSLFVHHTGKDVTKGALGSIAFYNAVDVQLLVKPRPAKITGKWDIDVHTAKIKGAKKQPERTYLVKMQDVEVSEELNPGGTELVLTPLPIKQPGVRRVEDDEFPGDEPEDGDAPAKVELSLDGVIAAEAEAAKPGDDVAEMLDRILGQFPEAEAKKRTVDRNLVKAIKARGLEVSKATGFPARRSVVDWEG